LPWRARRAAQLELDQTAPARPPACSTSTQKTEGEAPSSSMATTGDGAAAAAVASFLGSSAAAKPERSLAVADALVWIDLEMTGGRRPGRAHSAARGEAGAAEHCAPPLRRPCSDGPVAGPLRRAGVCPPTLQCSAAEPAAPPLPLPPGHTPLRPGAGQGHHPGDRLFGHQRGPVHDDRGGSSSAAPAAHTCRRALEQS
jgi:hypothetical protein